MDFSRKILLNVLLLQFLIFIYIGTNNTQSNLTIASTSAQKELPTSSQYTQWDEEEKVKIALQKIQALSTTPKEPLPPVIVSKKVTSEKIASKKVTPKKIVSKKITPKKIASKKVTPKKIVSKKVTPKKIVSKKVTPKKIASKKVTHKKIVSKKVTPKKIASKKVTPKKIVSKKVTPKKIASKKAIAKTSKRNKVAKYAKAKLGNKYVWGATGPNKFDCSGFTKEVFRFTTGIQIPRVSREQAKVGKYIKYKDLKEGDMVFFDTDKHYSGKVTHVGIYLKNGEFIHASSAKKRVIISSFKKKPFYKKRFLWGRRVIPTPS